MRSLRPEPARHPVGPRAAQQCCDRQQQRPQLQQPRQGLGPSGAAVFVRVVEQTATEPQRVPPRSTSFKAAADLGMSTDLYVLGYNGNNSNDFRGINRRFSGADARVTNQAVDGLSLTAFGRAYSEHTSMPSTPLGDSGSNAIYQEATLDLSDPPVDRTEAAGGVKGRWRPFYDYCLGSLQRGFASDGGYEYRQLNRSNVAYDIDTQPNPSVFVQPSTTSNRFFVGLAEDWTRALTTTLRYTEDRDGLPAVRSQRTGVVSALKDGLQIQRHRRIAGQQRDGDLRQRLRQPPGIDEVVFPLVEVVAADVVSNSPANRSRRRRGTAVVCSRGNRFPPDALGCRGSRLACGRTSPGRGLQASCWSG